jgi:predicted O-methyltransferase YrrM
VGNNSSGNSNGIVRRVKKATSPDVIDQRGEFAFSPLETPLCKVTGLHPRFTCYHIIMSDTTLNLTPPLYSYLQEFSLREPAVLKKLREENQKSPNGHMQISPEQGQFLRLLMEILNARKTLDIGVFTGYSALSVALALPKDGRVIGCDVNKQCTDIAKRYWEEAGVADIIDLRLGPALNTLAELIKHGEADSFDFIFIDADKTNYINYYEAALVLARSGGIIAIDNVLWGGKVADPTIQDSSTQTIRELNAFLVRDERISLSLLPIGDGLTLTRKK